jgi:hypothetical protein
MSHSLRRAAIGCAGSAATAISTYTSTTANSTLEFVNCVQ